MQYLKMSSRQAYIIAGRLHVLLTEVTAFNLID